MKAKIVGIGLLTATVAAVVLSPTLRGNAANVQVGPVGSAGKPKVEVVFVLDTTGSMGGLIDAAKEKIWAIAATMSQATPAPEISMGLVAYRDRGDAYVTRVVDLSDDLDSVYATLMGFAADGGGDGPESVNQALHDAVHGISWSQDTESYRVVFLVGDAPPHMDYQDDRPYSEIAASAAAKGIVINTIQCGNVGETAAHWERIASLGGGRYFRVEQAGGAVAIETPFDADIAEISARLDATRLYYGTAQQREAMERKVAATEALHEFASTGARARRGVFNATASGAVNSVGEHDLVHDVVRGAVDLEAVPAAELPPSLAGLSGEEQRRLVAETAARRESLQAEIAELAEQRDAFISERLEELGGAGDSLDRQLYEVVRSQGAAKGLTYEAGPRY